MINSSSRLEIFPGQVLHVPGAEPPSSVSSHALSISYKYKSPNISVKKALSLIPGSKVVKVFQQHGIGSTGWFFEFPPRTDECPVSCLDDWYKILRDNLTAPISSYKNEECAGFGFDECGIDDFDPSMHPQNPSKRPNSDPINVLPI